MREKIFKLIGWGGAGLFLDFVVSSGLYYFLSMPVVLCGMIGFLFGALVSYFVYLHVTFAQRKLSFSWVALYRFLKASLFSAVVRVFSLSLLDWLTDLYGVITLVLSIAISSLTRLVIANFYVFRRLAPSVNHDPLELPPSDTKIP